MGAFAFAQGALALATIGHGCPNHGIATIDLSESCFHGFGKAIGLLKFAHIHYTYAQEL